MTTLYGQAERAYIIKRARQLGLDPYAVLAVAAHEGITLPAQVGDQGTSFGPWQLHAGGALPAAVWQKGPDYAAKWANSAQGLDYALQHIAAVVPRGSSAQEAISNIVWRFEHPQDPGAETQAAYASYQRKEMPGFAQDPSKSWYSGITSAIEHPIRTVESPFKWAEQGIESLVIRALFILGGTALVMLGLYLIVRSFGKAGMIPAPSQVQQFASNNSPGARRDRAAYREHKAAGGPAKRERISTEPTPVYSTRTGRAAASGGGDDIPF